jgi:arylsulfatase A
MPPASPSPSPAVSRRRSFITQSAAAGQPFFLYFPFSHTHVPLMTASRWVNSSTAKNVFHDVVREVDNSVGEVIAALRDAGVLDSTYIFATADK